MLETKNIADIKKTTDYNGNTRVIIELPDSKYKEPLFSTWGTLFGYNTKSDGYEDFYELINKKLALSDYDIVMISKYDDDPFSLEIRLKEKDIETKQPNTGGKKKRSKKRMKSTKKKRHIKKRRYTKKRR
jgi:hypothetical protein